MLAWLVDLEKGNVHENDPCENDESDLFISGS